MFDRLPKYDKFLPMYSEFWLNYIKELLGIPERGVEDVNSLTSVGSQATLRLSMADFNGALLGVTKSRNHNMVGIKGIVIWDSQKNFIMVTKGDLVDEIKCIPKKGTVFNFEVPINERDALLYTILGIGSSIEATIDPVGSSRAVDATPCCFTSIQVTSPE